jgi:hypothetical protein
MLNDTDAREALKAVREAIDIPHGATVKDQEIPDRILIERAGHVVAMLAGIFGEDATIDVPWSVAYLRARLAEHPAVGYKTWGERAAELDAAKARQGGCPVSADQRVALAHEYLAGACKRKVIRASLIATRPRVRRVAPPARPGPRRHRRGTRAAGSRLDADPHQRPAGRDPLA